MLQLIVFGKMYQTQIKNLWNNVILDNFIIIFILNLFAFFCSYNEKKNIYIYNEHHFANQIGNLNKIDAALKFPPQITENVSCKTWIYNDSVHNCPEVKIVQTHAKLKKKKIVDALKWNLTKW